MSYIKYNIKRLLAFFCSAKDLSGSLIILTYHSVNPNYLFSVNPKEFEKQVCYLVKNFNLINLEDFNSLEKEKRETLVAITFDDGYEDNYLYAFPILKKYNIPATIFVTTDFVFNKIDITKNWYFYKGLKPLSTGQIKEMHKGGISFGIHGKTHRRLSNLTNEELNEEVKLSKETLESFLETEISLFSYPFGQKKDFNSNNIKLVKESGYKVACSNMWGINKIEKANQFSLRRIEINYLDNQRDFVNKLKGKWEYIKYFQKIRDFL